jgi:hypothetical protein
MKKLTELPLIFVQYPSGAGGWFLTALLHYSFDQSEGFYFDEFGSGHANQHIRTINNWYDEIVMSPIGMAIIHDDEHDKYTREERIEYLKNNVVASDTANLNIPQFICLHCVDIGIFLEAFPNSKCIQINITEEDLLACTVLFLRKRFDLEKFKMFCKEFPEYTDAPLMGYEKLQAQVFTKPELEYFKWATPYVLSLAKNVDNNPQHDDRLLEIMFADYITDDVASVVSALLNFVGSTPNKIVFDALNLYLIKYRVQQPSFIGLYNYE